MSEHTTMKTMPFKPCSEKNAIESTVFVVALAQHPTTDEAAALKQALDSFADHLPGVQQAQTNTLYIAFGNGQDAPPLEHTRFLAKPDGTHAWRVQLQGNLVQVMCFDYTRYAEVWATAQTYLYRLLATLPTQAKVTEVGMQVMDRFNYPNGTTADGYSAAELFNPQSQHLTRKAFDSGLLWHVYQGWFDKQGEPMRVLNQINISNVETAPTLGQYASLIEHRMSAQYRSDSWPTLEALTGQAAAPAHWLDALMSDLHADNKRLLNDVLSENAKALINLGANP